MIKNITTYLCSLRALDTDETALWTNGDRLTALKWFNGDDDCSTKGDEIEHLLEL